jgi:hypothetical protein
MPKDATDIVTNLSESHLVFLTILQTKRERQVAVL